VAILSIAFVSRIHCSALKRRMLIHNALVDIILSLTRTSRPGYLRDLRRLTVALSRARLGLYILGRRALFESCFELRPAFEKLFARPSSLALVTSEMYGATTRPVDDQEVDEKEGMVALMQGVEHLGQYVFEMTNAKVAALRAGNGALPPLPVDGVDGNEDTDEEEERLGDEDEAGDGLERAE